MNSNISHQEHEKFLICFRWNKPSKLPVSTDHERRIAIKKSLRGRKNPAHGDSSIMKFDGSESISWCHKGTDIVSTFLEGLGPQVYNLAFAISIEVL